MKRYGLAALLLLVTALTHYGYDPVAGWFFDGKSYAARNLFYCFRGLEGVVLFAAVGLLARRHPFVPAVCLWGLLEEGQTAACRVAKGVGEPNPAYSSYIGLCGEPWYVVGCFVAIVLASTLLDKLREGRK